MQRLFSKKILFGYIFIGVILIIGIVSGWSLYQSYSVPETREDKAPIEKRFGNIQGINKCYWKAKTISEDSLLAPGPTSYWMKGYIIADKNWVEKIKEEYQWESVCAEWKPFFEENRIEIVKPEWKYSDRFDSFVKPSRYFGKFYLDFKTGILYFDIQE